MATCFYKRNRLACGITQGESLVFALLGQVERQGNDLGTRVRARVEYGKDRFVETDIAIVNPFLDGCHAAAHHAV